MSSVYTVLSWFYSQLWAGSASRPPTLHLPCHRQPDYMQAIRTELRGILTSHCRLIMVNSELADLGKPKELIVNDATRSPQPADFGFP